MKRILLFFVILLSSKAANAYDVKVDGIYYNLIIKAKQAEVTSGDIEYSGEVTIPETISYEGVTYNVTSIKDGAFRNCNGLTLATIGNNVTSIGHNAFQTCENLVSVSIPNSVNNIGRYAFDGCKKLTSIALPEGVTSIEYRTFYGCNSLASVTISNNVTEIGDYAFTYCYNLTSINIPQSVKSIGEWAFMNSSLTAIVIPNSVVSIGENAFRNCELTSVSIGNGVSSIGQDAFWGCVDISSVYITDLEAWCKIDFSNYSSHPFSNSSKYPSSTIEHNLFLNGKEIKDLVIPNNVETISHYAFYRCTNLVSVIIPNSVKSIGWSTFEDCFNLASITISNSVTSIGGRAFSGCFGLTSVTIPNGVTSIGGYAFSGCSSLASVTIPNTVTYIFDWAFCGCTELRNVYCYAEEVPVTYSTTFQDSYVEYATLHVPEKSVAVYKSTEPWSAFGTIRSFSGEIPETPKCATPTIGYNDGIITFACDTEDVDFVSEITDTDIKKHYDVEIQLSATYHISVYATKTGYDNSDVAEATLCWIDGSLETEGTATNILRTNATPILIKTKDGRLTVEGLTDGSQISVYATTGTLVGTAVSSNGRAIVNTMMHAGCVAIVKTGEKNIKVIIR